MDEPITRRGHRRQTPEARARENAQERARRLRARLAPVPVGIPDGPQHVAGQFDPQYIYGQEPTRRMFEALAEYGVHGDEAEAAQCMGISYNTLRNTLHMLYGRVGATSGLQAAFLSGWLAWPAGLLRPHRKRKLKPLDPILDEDLIR